MAKRETLTLKKKPVVSADVASEPPKVEPISVKPEPLKVIQPTSPVKEVPPTPEVSITVIGVYELNNKKLIVITDIDTGAGVGMDATGQPWNIKTGRFVQSIISRQWDIARLVVKMPDKK